ncbi:uncharacterized protein METZ01_LOCUS403555 [marine metagenome]|uniref:Uncharacterized protein n=1 Tax=marine metagenome TaxID=408172 RepID=A0A382VXT2_9ZZZZ
MGFADVVWKDSGGVRRGRQYTAFHATIMKASPDGL